MQKQEITPSFIPENELKNRRCKNIKFVPMTSLSKPSEVNRVLDSQISFIFRKNECPTSFLIRHANLFLTPKVIFLADLHICRNRISNNNLEPLVNNQFSFTASGSAPVIVSFQLFIVVLHWKNVFLLPTENTTAYSVE